MKRTAIYLAGCWGVFFGLVQPAWPCTAFLLPGKGGPVLGRNYDWHLGDGLVIVNKRNVTKTALEIDNPARWTSKYGSVTFNQYGRELPSDGMNEAGLVVTMLWLEETEYPAADDRASVNTSQWVQYQLDTAATVAQVVASDKTIRIGRTAAVPVHFFVADKTGDCATIEFLDGTRVCHRGDSLAACVLANSTYARSLARLKGDVRRRWRFTRAAQGVEAYGAKSGKAPVDYAFDVLADVAQGDFTKWRIVYQPAASKISFRTHASPQVRSIDLSKLDFTAATPVKLLDINLDRSGDVTARFEDYTWQRNRALIGRSFAATPFLKDIPPIMLDVLARYPETFDAASALRQLPAEVFKSPEQ